jgi:hypothetical protein
MTSWACPPCPGKGHPTLVAWRGQRHPQTRLVTGSTCPDPLAGPGPGGSTVLHSESPLVHLQMLGNWALGRGFDLPDLDVHRPTLEEVYLSLTGPARKKDQR